MQEKETPLVKIAGMRPLLPSETKRVDKAFNFGLLGLAILAFGIIISVFLIPS